MTRIRLLVGAAKGAFVFTSDEAPRARRSSTWWAPSPEGEANAAEGKSREQTGRMGEAVNGTPTP